MDIDTVVVGAGLAGLTMAKELGGRGHRVMLVDAKAEVSRAVHTTGIFVRRTLNDYGLPESCLGPAIRRVVLHSAKGRVVELESGRDEFRIGRMGALYERLLTEAQSVGVCWAGSTRYRSSGGIAGGSAVWLERAGRRWRVRTRLIVGADGSVSRVARDLELDRNRVWLLGVEDVLEGTATGDAPALHCFLDPSVAPGYIGWVADDGEHVHVGVAGRGFGYDPAEALRRFRDRVSFDFGRLRRLERRGGRIPVNGVLRRIGCARGLLVGDAAGAVSPLTAGGLDPCLRLTAQAVEVADRFLMDGSTEVLSAYTGRPYQRHFVIRRGLRDVLFRLRHPLLAEAALVALRGPLRAMASTLFFGRGSFPDIALVEPAVANGRH
jgi:flavin-dependent dehydrogenase